MLDVMRRAPRFVDQAEVYWLSETSMTCSLQDGSLEYVRHGHRSATALRVIADGRMGAAFGESPEQSELLENAAAASKLGGEVSYGFCDETPARATHSVDERTAKLTMEDLVDALLRIDRELRTRAPDADANVICSAVSRTLRIATTEGMDACEPSTNHAVRVILPFADHGTDIGAYGLSLGTHWSPPSSERIAEWVERRCWGARPSMPSSGMHPVLLSPQVSNLLLIPLAAGLDGRAVAQGVSPLGGKIGGALLDEKLTIREDATHPRLARPRSFDDEGVACQPRTIVDHGILTGYLTDLHSAAALGISSTGNAVRRTLFSENIDDAPTPSILGAVIEPGEVSYQELIAGIDDGLLVTYIRGLHSGNLVQGDISVQVDGFHIVRGEAVGYLVKTMIAGNIYEIFRDVRALSLEIEATSQGILNVSALAPYILLRSVQVTVS